MTNVIHLIWIHNISTNFNNRPPDDDKSIFKF